MKIINNQFFLFLLLSILAIQSCLRQIKIFKCNWIKNLQKIKNNNEKEREKERQRKRETNHFIIKNYYQN